MARKMRKAFDTILSDYVDADTASKNGGFEPYRYECACCWEEVHLCAADSRDQATHFRHRKGNNNVKCDNYLGNRSTVISNALSRKNVRDKIEFYFSSELKIFSIGVKFSAEEIATYEKIAASFQIRDAYAAKPTISIPIRSSRFLPDVSELIPINHFSWEYYISSTNDSKQRKYEIFRKDGRDILYPSFFKIQANGDDDSFQAKLVRTETLYTNTPYLIMFTHQYYNLRFQKDVQVGKVITFRTMGRDFTGAVITFINKTQRVEQQLAKWKYKLEVNDTLTLLWPPSPQVDDTMLIKAKHAYLFSSFEMQAHGNINVYSEDIVKLDDGVSKVTINSRTKVYKKNAELMLSNFEDTASEYKVILVEQVTAREYKAQDDSSYLFNRSGVSSLSNGMVARLTTESEARHYSFGYLDRVVRLGSTSVVRSGEQILREILKYYKRYEAFNWGDFESLDLSSIAIEYIEACEKTGKINSAAKHFIEEGRV